MTPKQPNKPSIDASTDKKSSISMLHCKLASCGKEFKPKRKIQEFCCPNHRREFWSLSTRKIAELANDIEWIKKRLDKIEKMLEVKK